MVGDDVDVCANSSEKGESSNLDGGRTERPLRVVADATGESECGVGGGSATVTVGVAGRGGGISISVIVKSIFAVGVDVLAASHGSLKAGGRFSDGAIDLVTGCGS